MKKTYKKIRIFAVLLCLFAITSQAQLAGVYTINSNSVTGGTNFQTFNDLASILNNPLLGVSGAVTVNVVANSGPYNEQVNFIQAAGISPIQNIVINGNGCTLSYTSTNSGSPWTLGLQGADYMTFNDLNVGGWGTYALTIHLWSNADYNNFNSCTSYAPNMGSSSIQVPLSISGSGTSPTSTGQAGQYNIFTGCTFTGGYYNTTMYGNSGSPYSLGNQLQSCTHTDFYAYGIYCAYNRTLTVKSCTVERPNHPSPSTFYGVFFTTGVLGAVIDGNRIRKPFGGFMTSTGTAYGIYCQSSASIGNENIFKNNIISDFVFNGGLYAIYNGSYSYNRYLHNDIVIDDPGSTYTGTWYAVYAYGTEVHLKNNIIYIKRGGNGAKYGMYFASTMSPGSSNGNNIYYVSAGGSNYWAYYAISGTSALNNQTWNAGTGFDPVGFMEDPMFTNPAVGNYLPQSLMLNDQAVPVGVTNDVTGLTRSALTPDPGAYEFLNTPCSGPTPPSALSPNYFSSCPGLSNSNLQFATNYTVNGLTFQWYASTTSSVGPFTPVNGQTLSVMYTPTLGATTWFQAVVTCTNGGGAATSGVSQIFVQGVTTNTVPYYESFENIPLNNRLPNCSWSVTNPNTGLTFTTSAANNRIPNTGNKFASFYYSPAGQSYYYSNGIYMIPGITYSAGLWFISEAAANFTDLSILVGPNQNTTNQFSVASTSGPAVSPVYKALGGTFTVPSPGLYYVAIRATSTGGTAQYLTWDDLSVTIPCGPGLNAPPMSLTFNNAIVCAGTALNITASGADSYLWNNGSTNAAITETPNVNTTYTVVGTATLSGCKTTLTQAFTVKPAPLVSAYGFPPVSCSGKQVSLIGAGANSYTWSNNTQGPITNVAPITSQGYTVIGTGPNLCTAKATVFITVNQNPIVQGAASTPFACTGEQVTFLGNGATSYEWVSGGNNLLMQGQNVTITTGQPGNYTYTVTGTDGNGCKGLAQVNLTVDACTGLTKLNSATGISVYPNPNAGVFTIELNSGASAKIQVLDLTGRTVASAAGNNNKFTVDLGNIAAGIYYVKVETVSGTEVLKVVKQ